MYSQQPQINGNRLSWRIEAFREYLTFETLQPTAAVLKLFQGQEFSITNPQIQLLHKLLEDRTGKNAWIPNRSGATYINFNLEGDVTRNKGRVFTSMLITYPKAWVENKIVLTPFGNALADGRITKNEFYNFILSRYAFPHPAYEDHYQEWTNAGKKLLPFIYILEVLLNLYEFDNNNGYLSTEEIADYLHPSPLYDFCPSIAMKILDSRKHNTPPLTPRSDEVHRKITDLIGFLCLTNYCHYEGKKIALTPIALHHQELVSFKDNRNGQKTFSELKSLISFAKEDFYD